MKTIRMENGYSYVVSGNRTPVATVEPGELVEVYTMDTYGGRAVEEGDWPVNSIKYPTPAIIL